MRLGGDSIVPVNVRIIAASNKKLFHAVDANLFREDLYYRISVLNINIPPLRERRDDIPLLIRHFAKKCCRKYGLPPLQMEDNVMRHLCGYDWPGNVRQLENAVQKMVLSSENGIFREKDIAHLQLEMRDKETADDSLPLEGTLEEISRSVILAVLKEEGYNKTKTAHRLGITRVTLNKHLSVCNMVMDK